MSNKATELWMIRRNSFLPRIWDHWRNRAVGDPAVWREGPTARHQHHMTELHITTPAH